MTEAEITASATRLCNAAGFALGHWRVNHDGELIIAFGEPLGPRPKPWESDDDEDSGF